MSLSQVKAVILAGGIGSRLSEETAARPKPMVEIGGRPILWHIMKIFSYYGVKDFVVCLGYKGYMIKEYFMNYSVHMADVTIDVAHRTTTFHQSTAEPWRVTLVDTGETTMTGGRLKRVRRYLGDADFFMTYGDGVGDVNLAKLFAFHKGHGRPATVTAVHPQARFGVIETAGDEVVRFEEKPEGDGMLINGGFFVLHPRVIDYVEGDHMTWELEPMKLLAEKNELRAFRHAGFWHPMDTLRDKTRLEELWRSGLAPWKLWGGA